MRKFLILTAVLFLGRMTSFCQTDSGIGINGGALIVTYMSGDTTSIQNKWKLEEDETLDVQDMLDIQSDVFGEFEYPKTFNLSESISKKYTVSTMKLNRVFTKDRSAHVEFEIYKGKKKKHPHQLQEIRITSSSASLEPLLDSLCAPYIDLILKGQTDSLIELAFHTNELKELMDTLKRDGSKKEIEKAEMMCGFMQFAREIVEDAMKMIDTSKYPSFETCELQLKRDEPSFKVQYSFTGKDKNEAQCTFSFQLKDDAYELTGIAAGTGSRRNF
ncbi:MAG: hypothetical protein P8P74_04585 [Crocinitomicaceae bacterium]|nr:hypothetical protein [Crocinitomicaceae bacterium]